MTHLMHLKIVLPDRIFLEEDNVKRVNLSSVEGSQGVYPRRRDFATALVPGIFTFESEGSGLVYLAVDQGLALKTGPEILVSTHNATRAESLGHLREAMEKELLHLDEIDSNTRATLRKLETDMLRRIKDFSK